MNVELFEGERLDYIAGTELQIIQSPDVFSYSIDAILLGRFVRVPIQKGRLLDLCTGNGVIPLLLATRTKGELIGVEIQEKLIQMAKRTIEFNNLQSQIQLISANLNDIPAEIKVGSFDVVTCNPPYFETMSNAELNDNPYFAIARHEIHCSLEDVIRVCSEYVKQKGKVALVHRPERLTDMLTLMRMYRIEPKRIQFIYPKAGKDANMVLVEGIKDGKSGVSCLGPLIIYNERGEYTEAFRKVYEGRE
ncbi:tRNA1(Val) (adenine(37)-N6)-methyltransferase [bacterium LRH843]|nr:tRNA1(Val) (adenine(37)-N6)-methyltransferase [bacterium LRH843]